MQLWDAADFDPWGSLRWTRVRVLRYRQIKPNREVIEAYWLTNFSAGRVGSRTLYRMAKSRWEIESQGFNEAKIQHGTEHICHHQTNSLLVQWLMLALALIIERLYRLRCLHRGTHRVRTAIELVRQLWLSLSAPKAPDSSQWSGQAAAAWLFSVFGCHPQTPSYHRAGNPCRKMAPVCLIA